MHDWIVSSVAGGLWPPQIGEDSNILVPTTFVPYKRGRDTSCVIGGRDGTENRADSDV